MATQLFKDGGSTFVETDQVQRYLGMGWSPDDPNGPATSHPDVIYPAGLNLEKLPVAEAEKTVLDMMGIKPPPIAVIGQAEEQPRQKRKYTRKAH